MVDKFHIIFEHDNEETSTSTFTSPSKDQHSNGLRVIKFFKVDLAWWKSLCQWSVRRLCNNLALICSKQTHPGIVLAFSRVAVPFVHPGSDRPEPFC